MENEKGKLLFLPPINLMRYSRESVSEQEIRWIYSIADQIMDHIDAECEHVGERIVDALTMAFKKGHWTAINQPKSP